MFYYYGRKKKFAGRYPSPVHPVIIEPFAGSAAYSLHEDHWKRKVILVEKDPQVAALWRWLIHDATPNDILGLPDMEVGQRTDLFLHLLHMASKRAFTYNSCTVTPFMVEAWKASRPYMARSVHKVKHWEVTEGDYKEAPDIEATWFVDPPYQGEPGVGYRFGSGLIDYAALASWCRSRQGAMIVCEGAEANWLPFKDLVEVSAIAGKKHQEKVYLSGFSAPSAPFEGLW
jgi:hypothetical protein